MARQCSHQQVTQDACRSQQTCLRQVDMQHATSLLLSALELHHHVVVWWQAHTCAHDVLQHCTLLGQGVDHRGAMRHEGCLPAATAGAAPGDKCRGRGQSSCVLGVMQCTPTPRNNASLSHHLATLSLRVIALPHAHSHTRTLPHTICSVRIPTHTHTHTPW